MYITKFPLDNIFIVRKSLLQRINMFQRKFEWSFNRSHLRFCKRKIIATFKQCKSSCVGFLFVFFFLFFLPINNEEASSVCFPDITASECFFSGSLVVAQRDIKLFALIIIKAIYHQTKL